MANLVIDENRPRLEIVDEGAELVLDSRQVSIIEIGQQGPVGAQGEQGIPGQDGTSYVVGGLVKVEDDPDPHLGGDLILGSYNIVGQLENSDLILDAGLM